MPTARRLKPPVAAVGADALPAAELRLAHASFDSEGSSMERWTLTMIRHRWVVVAVWVVVFLVSGIAASGLSALLTNRFSIPGSDTAKAEKILHDHFGQRSDGSFQLVYQANPGQTAAEVLPALEQAGRRVADEIPTGRFVSARRLGPHRNRNGDVRSRAGRRQELHGPVRAAAGQIQNGKLYVTGAAAITKDTDEVFAHDAKVGEALHRDPDRARNPRLCLRNLCLPPADALRCRRDPGDARDHLDPGALHGAFDLSPTWSL